MLKRYQFWYICWCDGYRTHIYVIPSCISAQLISHQFNITSYFFEYALSNPITKNTKIQTVINISMLFKY